MPDKSGYYKNITLSHSRYFEEHEEDWAGFRDSQHGDGAARGWIAETGDSKTRKQKNKLSYNQKFCGEMLKTIQGRIVHWKSYWIIVHFCFFRGRERKPKNSKNKSTKKQPYFNLQDQCWKALYIVACDIEYNKKAVINI